MLYFASGALLTYDGDRWQSVPVPGSFAIRSLSFGSDGRLWAGTTGDIGWFDRTAGFDWRFHSLRGYLPETGANLGEVWGISADNNGTTFVCTDRILRWNGRDLLIWDVPSERKLFPTRSGGKFYVHQIEKGLYEVEASGPQLRIDRNILGDSVVLWLERHAQQWLLGTSKGFFTFDGTKLVPFAPAISEFLQTGTLSCAVRLPDRRIAVGTVSRGIAFLSPDGSLDSLLGDKEGLPSPHITSLFVSRDRELWATTGSHILRIDIQAHSTVFDERAGLPRQTYRKITKWNDTIFVANESGVFELLPNTNRFVPVNSLPGRWQEIRGIEGGVLASGFRGTSLWNASETKRVYPTKFDIFTAAEVRDHNEEFFLADPSSILRLNSNHTSRVVVKKLPDLATSLAEEPNGQIWIGTLARGVSLARPQGEVPVEAQSPPESFRLPPLVGTTHVRTNAAGTVMVFANNGAWQKLPGRDVFDPVFHFPARKIAAVSEMADDGTLWVAFENTGTLAPCVGRVSFVDASAIWEPHAVDGLIDVGAPRSIYADHVKAGETVLWIGGTHALLRHVVGPTLSATAPRAPLLRAFARHGPRQPREPILAALPYSTELLEFEFAAPEFARRSLLRIETRIEGVDHEWTPVAPGSRRELTAIRDGHYTVTARVVAETGVVSPEAIFSFEVLPPWWRTAPALTAFGLAAALFVLAAYRLRIRALRRRTVALEAKVRERTIQLERANASKTQFVANMSHDIRNPLNGIVGLALALEDTRLDNRQREIVATLRECTTYLSSLVDDVLDFASIEAGRVELRPRAFGPQELLRSIVETLKADATASGATLLIEVGDDMPPNLFGDAGRIQQILVNFVSNALKYAGGTIRLSVSQPANAPGEVEFAVADEGQGISADEQATLFTKFSRLRQRRGGEEIPGAGLGLAACRLLADIMGGSVGVTSRDGEGARFYLRLPLSVAPEPIAAPADHLPHTAVLLVEDTDYNAWAASAVLAKLGLSCERARTGAEALQAFAQKRFNVVLLDRNLPDMDGTEVARRMREMESDGRQAVILAVTAYCTAEDRELCLRSGMDAFLGKPLTPEKLRKVLRAAGRRLLTAAPVHALPETPAAELDFALLSYLSDGSAEGLELQAQRFLASLGESTAELTAAAARRDLVRLRTAAHRLLGQARMVGGGGLADAASELEAAARSGDEQACDQLLQRVRDETEGVTAAMRHHRPAAHSV